MWGTIKVKAMFKDKLRKGKRDSTPEKPTTPNASQDALQEEGTPQSERHTVIVSDEILGLAIRPEDLQKLHEPKPPAERKKTPVTTSVIVRKLKPASEWDKPPPKIVTVARPAPADAPLKPIDYSDGAGVRFNHTGHVIPHSILGSVDEYKTQALRSGDISQEVAAMVMEDYQPKNLTAKYGKEPPKHPKMESVDESNALRNWQAKMLERKRQQGHLSKLLKKPPDQLVMNQSDSFRKTQELRYLIDRTIPSMDYGKGYRVGSEFWKQQERVGDELTGMHMMLNQTERGYPPPIEHVGIPNTILEEKGTDWSRPTTPYSKPWHKSHYLHQRATQLNPVMDELDPFTPDLRKLEIIGVPGNQAVAHCNQELASAMSKLTETKYTDLDDDDDNLDPLRDIPDVHAEPVFGPSVLFAGQPARWTGDSGHLQGHVGIEARVTFEAYSGRRATSFLEIVNDGTTSVYYDWKRIPKSNPFDLVNAKVQRFYFNNSNGVILPGEAVKFPFVFKSPNAGVFTEQWQLQTHPVVCGGAALVVTLRGVALQEDKFKKQRSEIEQELAHKQAQQVIQGILADLLESIKVSERPPSPIDSYVTEMQLFERKNSTLYYHNESVHHLKELYLQMYPQEEREGLEWDFSIQTLKDLIMSMDEEDEWMQEMLQRVNSAVIAMSFPPFTPAQQRMHTAGYEILCDVTDALVERCVMIRSVLGLPDREVDDVADEPSDSKKPAAGGKVGKQDAKDKKASGRESKLATPKTPASREAPKQGKITPASVISRRPATRERVTSPGSGTLSPLPSGVDPVLHAKYKDKIYTQTYLLLSEGIERMEEAFCQLQQDSGGPPTPSL